MEQKEIKRTELVFIIDESGSMCGLVDDTIGGINTFLAKQREEKLEGEVIVSLVTFSTRSRVVYDRIPLDEMPDITKADYVPRGSTALYDALGFGIRHIKNIHKYVEKENAPEKTIFVIMTDGMENASRFFNRYTLKAAIESAKAHGWEFVFLAANIDATLAAETIGIERDHSIDWLADSKGEKLMFEGVSSYVSASRFGKKYRREEYFADVDDDIIKRGDKGGNK